jgi:phytoene synthase
LIETTVSQASDITRRAKSNLAFALRILPAGLRADTEVFYAFCRTVDDLADEETPEFDVRKRCLNEWKDGLIMGFAQPDALQSQVVEMCARREIPVHLMTAIIDGCLMDLEPRRFSTWQELEDYIWNVACAVGLVSIRLFGCTAPESAPYAEALGKALQLTNILRDIAEDLGKGGRIYLPIEDLAAHGYSADDLLARVDDQRFHALLDFEARRAEGFFHEAEARLPAADRKALKPALIMAEIYQDLLATMRRDGFKVLRKRYSVPHLKKIAILSKHLIAGG